jgi:hypothetical protein
MRNEEKWDWIVNKIIIVIGLHIGFLGDGVQSGLYLVI